MINIDDPIKSYEFLMKTSNAGVPCHRFFLEEDDVHDSLNKIRKNGNIYDTIPGLRKECPGSKDVILNYGMFLGTKTVFIDSERYATTPKQIGGLLLPHYQVLSRSKIDDTVMGMELSNLEHAIFVRALDNFPRAKQFHRMLSFEFKPVMDEDIVLNAEQLRIS